MERIYIAANNGDIGGEGMLIAMAELARELGREVTVVAPSGSSVLAVSDEHAFSTIGIKGAGRKAYLKNLRGWDTTARDGWLWCNGLVPALATAGRRDRVVHLHLVPRGAHAVAYRLAKIGADFVVAPSEYVGLHVPEAEVLVNWADRIHAKIEPPGRVPAIVGFIGRPSVIKGVVVLAEAISILKSRGVPIRLLVAGESYCIPQAEQDLVDAALARLGNTVKRVGWIDKPDFFSSVDLSVFPSLMEETVGLVVAEAMSAHARFVISDVGALPEVAGPDHPWIVPKGDAVRLAETIKKALEDRGTAQLERAFERWEKLYSPESGRERYAALLARIP